MEAVDPAAARTAPVVPASVRVLRRHHEGQRAPCQGGERFLLGRDRETAEYAVQAALNKISAMVLDSHLNSCVITAIQGEDPAERERVLQEVSSVFAMSNKK